MCSTLLVSQVTTYKCVNDSVVESNVYTEAITILHIVIPLQLSMHK